MGREIEFSIVSELARVPLLAAAVRGALEGAQVDSATARGIECCVAEWSNNVIEHGYGGEPGHPLRITLDIDAERVLAQIQDSARPFDPVAKRESCRTSLEFDPTDLSSLPERGMGLSLIHATMDEVKHRLTAEGNSLEMVRYR